MNAHRSAGLHTGAMAGAIALAGCTNMSGLNGSSSYACKAPDGVICDSVSGTYANAMQNNLPSQQKPRAAAVTGTGSPAAAASAASAASSPPPRPVAAVTAAATPMPPRSSARVLRLWFKPWEDADRDLYDQGYVYVQIDSGQWLIEHVQRQIREAHAPLRPPPRSAAPTGDGKQPPASPTGPQLPSRLPPADHPLQGWVPPASRPTGSD